MPCLWEEFDANFEARRPVLCASDHRLLPGDSQGTFDVSPKNRASSSNRRDSHPVPGGAPLSLSLSKALLNILYNNPAQTFSIDELLRFREIKKRKPLRNTVRIHLRRHLTNQFIERVRLADGRTWGFRLLNANEAIAFIRDDKNKSWLKVPPNPPAVTFEIQNRHRVTYLVHLSKEDLERARDRGVLRPNRRNGGIILVREKEFTLSVSAVTGKGQIWLFNGWDAAVRRVFSAVFYQNLVQMVSAREGHEHISVPVEFMGHRIRIGGSDLLLCGSHYPLEIDISGPERETKKTQAVRMLTNQLEFNKVLLEIREGIDHILARQAASDRRHSTTEQNLEVLAKNQADIVKVLNHNAEAQKYEPGVEDPGISYR